MKLNLRVKKDKVKIINKRGNVQKKVTTRKKEKKKNDSKSKKKKQSKGRMKDMRDDETWKSFHSPLFFPSFFFFCSFFFIFLIFFLSPEPIVFVERPFVDDSTNETPPLSRNPSHPEKPSPALTPSFSRSLTDPSSVTRLITPSSEIPPPSFASSSASVSTATSGGILPHVLRATSNSISVPTPTTPNTLPPQRPRAPSEGPPLFREPPQRPRALSNDEEKLLFFTPLPPPGNLKNKSEERRRRNSRGNKIKKYKKWNK